MPKILVADDNANIQKMVVLAFEERGIQVVTVGNGEAAVRRIPDASPDLVLADIFMPVRNGYEVCEFVKKDERFSHVPVILLVGAFDPLDEREARRVGADGVLKKPFVPPDPLIAMVMSALEKNPKVAAEMAKAKQAKEVLPPEPMERLEIPARPEPKPLPDFPEPTAEEAAQIYAFGKGVRAMDDEPAGPAGGPKPPVAEKEEIEEEDFDGASTSSDWRRNAMDFEVPADAANMPAFSADDNLDPSQFPSEKDFPPRHVRVPEPIEEAEPVVSHKVPAPVEDQSSASEFFRPSANDPEPVVSAEVEPALESREPQTVEEESSSEPATAVAPAVRHWMDSLSPAQAGSTGGAWMTSLPHQDATPEAAASSADERAESLEHSSPPMETVEAPAEVDAAPETSEPPAWNSAGHSTHEEPFVDASAASGPAESWFAPAPSVFDSTSDPVSQPVPVAPSQPDQAFELESAEPEPPIALKDPALMESPAVHVTPEPLLMDDDESQAPSEYGSRPQDVSPLHSFFAPSPEDRVPEAPASASLSADHHVSAPSFDPFAASEANERIPTGPPPNREALAGIPFLTPPPGFSPDRSDAAPSSENVDDAVRKVLEKLEPRLHDLLSQGVLKPLIENLLHSELAKKDK